MGKVIPDYLSDGRDCSYYAGSAYSSNSLIMGEVQEIIQPNDPRNINKNVPEYTVWATVFENGGPISRMFNHVVPMDLFGSGIADYFNFTYRGENSAQNKTGIGVEFGYGKGSRVLMLAINGDRQNYVIISGIRNSQADPIDSDTGHHLDFNFNGIECNINNDGELTLTYSGATKADGTLQDDVDTDAVGTTLTITKDGSLSIVDNSSNESIVIDRPNGNINVAASSGVTIKAQQIALGPQPNSPAVIGTQLVSVLQQLCLAISSISVVTAGAPSSPPVNAAQFVEISSTLNTILSQIVTLQ
jgi:hypothetical protein